MNQISLTKSVKVLALFLSLLWGSSLSAATYYVSSTGNDANTDTQAQNSATPWKTINRLNLVVFKTGDVVLFKRGEVFAGEIKVTGGVTYASYGAGIEPIITGTVPIKNWTVYKGNIYVASVTSPVKNIFVNNKQMTFARFPNTGLLYIDKGINLTSFTDAALTQGVNYWAGATVKIYIRDYSIVTKKVLASAASTLTLATPLAFTSSLGDGYFFDNKLSELDVEKEWFYDEVNNKVYLYAPGGVNPNNLQIEGAAYDYGFKGAGNAANVVIKDFRIEKQALDGISLIGNNFTIANNKFYLQGENGISYMGNNVRIEKNYFEAVNGRGIIGDATTKSFILNNTFKKIGLIVGEGVRSTAHTSTGAIVIGLQSSYLNISYNKIDSTGGTAIRADGTYHNVEKNIIEYPMLTFADGGGIYMWGINTHHNTIKDNFIFYPQGMGNARLGGIAYGIYMDMDVHHCTVINNTVVGSRYGGILFNSGNHDHVIRNNISFGNELSALKFDDYTEAAPVFNNTVSKNVLYTLNPDSPCLHINSRVNRYNFGKADSNYYCNPYSDYVVRRSQYTAFPAFVLDQWQTQFQQDLHSKKSLSRWELCEPSQATGNTLISNGAFDANITGWNSWAGAGATKVEFTGAAGLDGGSLKFTMLTNTNNNGFAISPSFAVTKDQYYQLSFSVKASKAGKVNVMFRQAHSPYSTIYAQSFPLYATRKDYNHVLKMPIADAQIRIDLEILFEDKEFWLDNLSLVPVNIVCHKAGDRSFIFTNPSDVVATINLGTKAYKDLDGRPVTGSLKLNPWTSQVLVADLNPAPNPGLRNPENPTGIASGVDYSYYEGTWGVMPNYAAMTPIKKGTIDNFSLTPKINSELFGFSYSGYVNVPTDGTYTFYTSSDDGSQLYIGDALVVNNDGLHALVERSGTIGLKAGKHLIKVLYFERSAQEILTVSYAGPNLAKTAIPATALFRKLPTTGSRMMETTEVIETEGEATLNIFPNPAKNDVVITSTGQELEGVKVTNDKGMIIYSSSGLKENELKIQVNTWPQGLYFVEVSYSSGKKEWKRLVISS